MNTLLNPTQSDTKKGDITVIAATNLTGKEGYLTKLTSSGGVVQAALPASQADLALYVVDSGDVIGNEVSVEAPNISNFRAKAYGTGSTGTPLVLADPTANSGAQAGMVTALPATPGEYFSPGIAEEDFLDGQLVLTRPMPRMIRVKSADSLSALTFTAAGATGPEVAALRNQLKAILEAQNLMA